MVSVRIEEGHIIRAMVLDNAKWRNIRGPKRPGWVPFARENRVTRPIT